MVKKNPKIRSCDLGPWSISLKLSGFRAVAKIHAPAKFHRVECSGSWVIVLTVKNSDENNTVRRYRADSNRWASRSRTWRRRFAQPRLRWWEWWRRRGPVVRVRRACRRVVAMIRRRHWPPLRRPADWGRRWHDPGPSPTTRGPARRASHRDPQRRSSPQTP